jgi:hypothetical protein
MNNIILIGGAVVIFIVIILIVSMSNKKVDCELTKDTTFTKSCEKDGENKIKYTVKTSPNSKGKKCMDLTSTLESGYTYTTDSSGNIIGTKSCPVAPTTVIPINFPSLRIENSDQISTNSINLSNISGKINNIKLELSANKNALPNIIAFVELIDSSGNSIPNTRINFPGDNNNSVNVSKIINKNVLSSVNVSTIKVKVAVLYPQWFLDNIVCNVTINPNI